MSTINLIFTSFIPEAASHIGESLKKVLTNGFDERNNHPISPSRFLPYTKFKRGIDLSNGDQYSNDDSNVRLKCLALAAATPIIHAVGTLLNLSNRIAKLISFAHFWHPSQKEYRMTERAWSFGKDLLRVAFAPIIYVGLELSALYGLILPENGRKLYATFERSAYGKELLAPSFQPNAMWHVPGGFDLPDDLQSSF